MSQPTLAETEAFSRRHARTRSLRRDQILRAADRAERRAAQQAATHTARLMPSQSAAILQGKRARWDGASGTAYDTTIHALHAPDLGAIRHGVALAVRRSADDVLTIVAAEPFVAGSVKFSAFCSWSGRKGATELHVHRLADEAAQGRDAIVRDLLSGREVR